MRKFTEAQIELACRISNCPREFGHHSFWSTDNLMIEVRPKSERVSYRLLRCGLIDLLRGNFSVKKGFTENFPSRTFIIGSGANDVAGKIAFNAGARCLPSQKKISSLGTTIWQWENINLRHFAFYCGGPIIILGYNEDFESIGTTEICGILNRATVPIILVGETGDPTQYLGYEFDYPIFVDIPVREAVSMPGLR